MNFDGSLLGNGILVVRFVMLISHIVQLPHAISFSWYFLPTKLTMNLEPQTIHSFGSMKSTFIISFNQTDKHVMYILQYVGVDFEGIQIKLNEHEINK
jgi:hypothetical protein